jgi:tripartite-type tricarboxylate transporter receptor subunit TctC
VSKDLTENFGQSVIVENKPGGSAAIGSEHVARATPDGHTLLLGSTTTISINPVLIPNLSYSPGRDFVPVSLLGSVPHVLLVSSQVPAKSLKEFLKFGKDKGRSLSYGSGGNGTPHHIAGEIFKSMTGIEMVHVPYKGSAPALSGLMGDEVQFSSVDLPAALPQLGSGRIRALAIAAPKRDPLAPDVPTTAEAGLPGFEIQGWYGLFAPAGTPKAIVEKLSAGVSRALGTPEAREAMKKLGVNILGGSADEFAAHIKREDAKWAKAIKDNNIRLE